MMKTKYIRKISELTEKDDTKWMIKNRIAKNQLTMFVGGKGTGKTFTGLALASIMATGNQCLGECQPSRVLYLMLEGHDTLRLRYEAIKNEYNNGEPIDNLFAFWEVFDICDKDAVKHLIYQCKEAEIEYVFIDTYSRAINNGDTSDERLARSVRTSLDMFCISGLGVMLIHHTGKDVSKGAMGSSVLENDASWILRLTKHATNQKTRLIKLDKTKDHCEGEVIPVYLKEVAIDGIKTLVMTTKDESMHPVRKAIMDIVSDMPLVRSDVHQRLKSMFPDMKEGTLKATMNRHIKELQKHGFLDNVSLENGLIKLGETQK